MQQKQDSHVFTGMLMDMDVAKVQPNYLIDAHNIRLTALENETMLSITNEKGTQIVSNIVTGKYVLNADKTYTWVADTENITLRGHYVGSCVINNYYILFTSADINNNFIYRFEISDSNTKETRCTILYSGKLNFSVTNPFEVLTSYENESIQKVYWTDGVNQPRIINIAPYADKDIANYNSNSFDFCPELLLLELVNITKSYSNGSFSPGVIQYAFTYYNKFRQETTVFYTTPLYYISHSDRGGSPEDTCANSFTIKVTNVDTNFDYLRIYSIQRTSLDGTPICKQLQDIYIKNFTSTDVAMYTDTGTGGSTIASTDLLYKGGLSILAETMCDKDGTLFLGNITLKKPAIPDSVRESIGKEYGTTNPFISEGSTCSYYILEREWTKINNERYFELDKDNCALFKSGEYYRFGIQFLYKTGEWSEPIWLGDAINNIQPFIDYRTVFHWLGLSEDNVTALTNAGFKKMRGMIASPSFDNRIIVAQGVLNSTIFRPCDRYGVSPNLEAALYDPLVKDAKNGTTYAQASWLFRPMKDFTIGTKANNLGGYITRGTSGTGLRSIFNGPLNNFTTTEAGLDLRGTEIGGYLKKSGKFYIEAGVNTVNSPEMIWNEGLLNYNFSTCGMRRLADIIPSINYGDMDITTESTTMSSNAKGYVRRAFSTEGDAALISLYCYSDCILDDNGDDFEPYTRGKYPTLYPLYMWHSNGPINNDINRESCSSKLKTKVISNYKFAIYQAYDSYKEMDTLDIQAFSDDNLGIIKLGTNGYIYMGNIDTSIAIEPSPEFFGGVDNSNDTTEPWTDDSSWDTVNYDCRLSYFLMRNVKRTMQQWGWDDKGSSDVHKVCKIIKTSSGWDWKTVTDAIGDDYPGLTEKTNPIRMRYKSTPHIVTLSENAIYESGDTAKLYLVDIYKKGLDLTTIYGGTSETAIKNLTWIPAGLPIDIATSSDVIYKYGDSYSQFWECLKTYPWSSDDLNLVVEIMNFPVESHINMDGRYDRNRGSHSNLNVSPDNFNLINMAYSLLDNYFSYKVLDDSYYDINNFPNLITWSLLKNSGDDVDPWCSLPLTSTFDVDGSKGEIVNLSTWNNNIYCFLNQGISNILFNERALIATSDGVPIEISNNYKVEGKRYLSDGLGVVNKFSIKVIPSGIYFIDAITKDLFLITTLGLANASLPKNMSTYFNSLINEPWSASNYTTKLFYDSTNSDVYITSENDCLLFSEKLTEFTSFMSYEGLPDMFNVGDNFFCVKQYRNIPVLYRMFKGSYNEFFHTDSLQTDKVYKGYDFTFVCNGRSANPDTSTLFKTITNIEFRADRFEGFDYLLALDDDGYAKKPLSYIRAWNEYQDTSTKDLVYKRDTISNLKQKNRVWRIEVPRNSGSRDRISNMWTKIKLGMKLDETYPNSDIFNLHDLSVIYYV